MKQLFIFAALVLLAGCGGGADAEILRRDTTANNYEVELLFEHDGCKVYTFYDWPRQRVYFTNCNGSVSWETTRKVGKTTRTEHHNVSTSATDSISKLK